MVYMHDHQWYGYTWFLDFIYKWYKTLMTNGRGLQGSPKLSGTSLWSYFTSWSFVMLRISVRELQTNCICYCNMYTNWICYKSISARINNFTLAKLDKPESHVFGGFIMGHNDLTKLTFAVWRSICSFLKIWYNHFICQGAGTWPLCPPNFRPYQPFIFY